MTLKMISFQILLMNYHNGEKIKYTDLPLTKSTEVLYVNKNLLKQLGYTIDDLKDLTIEKLAEISEKCQ